MADDEQRRGGKRISKPLAVAAATGITGLALGAGGTAHAEVDVEVTSLDDSGAGTLRQAVLDAEADGGGTITFDATLSGTIALESEIPISTTVEIKGPGAQVITVSGAAVNSSPAHRIFNIAGKGDTVTISGLTLSGGEGGGDGGAILAQAVDLTVDHVVVTDNVAQNGGGIRTGGGELTVLDSVISGNGDGLGVIFGGGIATSGTTVDIERSTIDDNSALVHGGGIWAANGSVTISQSTISNNTAEHGGGLYLFGVAQTSITNSTISGNQAVTIGSLGDGGGLFLYYTGVLDIESSTVADNHADAGTGGIRLQQGNGVGFPVTLNNSIVADNTGATPPALNAQATDFQIAPIDGVTATYTLESDQFLPGTGNLTGSPDLGELGDNGGPTETMRPAGNSPVVNAGDPDYTPPPDEDQRLLDRVSGGRIEMGAVELQVSTFSLSVPDTVGEGDGSVTATITRTDPADPVDVTLTTTNGTATAGADYTAISQTVHFAAGQSTATVPIPILEDTVLDPGETFTVTLSDTPNVVAPETVTITDNDVAAEELVRTGVPVGLEAAVGVSLVASGMAVTAAGQRRRRRFAGRRRFAHRRRRSS